MFFDDKVLLGRTEEGKEIYLYPKMANRHGLIAGATGTGKTVTLKVLAESFSDAGVPVFLADAKGDLQGMCTPGTRSEDMEKRISFFELDEKSFDFKKYPVNFWDVYGEKGIPLRTTISEMGPLLLSRIMNLNDTQTDILNIIFKIADDNELLLIDTKDLKSMIQFVAEHAAELSREYGNLPESSLNVLIRGVISLETEGAEKFFAEPALNIRDWIACDQNGRGFIQVLECQKLMLNPRMYSMFLLWMISELYEILPEAGDLDKPKMVFFFDEAHMLFDSAPSILLEKIEQVVKLIRSKGVGIYFITQNPKDIPGGVLSQLGNKVQHALHAYTPSEQKAVKAAADGFRVNPAFNTMEVLGELGTGEALISVLGEDGVPTIVERAKVLPPSSHMGFVDDAVFEDVKSMSYLFGKYNYYVDNDSAYERITAIQNEEIEYRRALEEEKIKAEEEEKARIAAEKEEERARIAAEKEEEKARIAAEKEEERARVAAEREAERERKAAEREEARLKAQAEREAQRAAAAEERARLRAEEKAKKDAEKAEAAKKKVYKNAAKSVASTTASTIGREIGNSFGKNVGGTFGKKLGGNVGSSLARGIIGTFFK